MELRINLSADGFIALESLTMIVFVLKPQKINMNIETILKISHNIWTLNMLKL